MGKKRVTYCFNDEDKPPNGDHGPVDHHHHEHQRRRQTHQKPKKLKSEVKLLTTLNSHFKKLSKYRSRKLISLSSPPSNNILLENNKKHHGLISSWLKNNQKGDRYDWFMDFDFDHGDQGAMGMGAFEFGQELFEATLFDGYQNNSEDLFGDAFVFASDLNASNSMVKVFEEYGLGYGSYIPDPFMKVDNGDEGKHIYDMLKLSSQEEMINEFLKVNLFVS